MINREFAQQFADDWIAAWKCPRPSQDPVALRRRLEMASPLIVEIAGEPSGVLRGKPSVGAYWEKALRLSPDLRFEKLGVFVGL